MRINELTAAIVACYPTRQPLMLWGAPGVGKSSAAVQAADSIRQQLKAKTKGAKSQDFGFIDLRLPLLESVDLRGLPMIDKGITRWIPPSFLPTSGAGLLLLDEIVQASLSMQAAASQLILDRKCGEYELPPGWMVLGAGNLVTHRAAANAMPTHIANRFIHLYAEVSVDAWVEWALKKGIDMRLIAFIKWRANLLHSFDPQAKVQAFPSPRSWEFVGKLLTQNLPTGLMHQLVKGAVGEAAAGEFMGFLLVFDKMPSIESILLNPSTAPIPTEMSVLYAVTTSLTHRATADNIGKMVTYLSRITKEAGRPEFSVMAMKEIAGADAQRDKKITNTRAFAEWASAHNEVIV